MEPETGLNVSGLMRDYLVRAGVPFGTADTLSQEFDAQLTRAAWLRTFDGTTFELAYRPRPTPM